MGVCFEGGWDGLGVPESPPRSSSLLGCKENLNKGICGPLSAPQAVGLFSWKGTNMFLRIKMNWFIMYIRN